MTDLEITRLCAEAMGYSEYDDSTHTFIDGIPPDGLCVLDEAAAPIDQVFYFDPLHDDAQAMALVKKFPAKSLRAMSYEMERNADSRNYDFNRAICTWIANIQKA